MERKPFGVQLKTTGVSVTRNLSHVTSTTTTTTMSSTRASIHTPLKPANVKDLKAKFDSSKKDGGTRPTVTNDSTSSLSSSTSAAVASSAPNLKPRETSGVQIVRVSSTSSSSSVSSPPTTRRTKFNTQTSSGSLGGGTKSDSTEDLLAKYRSNRTGLYRNEQTSAESKQMSALSKQTSDSSRQTSSETRQTFMELKSSRTKTSLPGGDVSVPKLNLRQLSSDQMEILCGSSSPQSDSRKSSESPRSDSRKSSDSSPRSSASSSPRLIGKVKPKYFPSSRSSSVKSDSGRVEIPIEHQQGVSSSDSVPSAITSSRQFFTKTSVSESQPRYGQVMVTEGRFRSNGTSSNPESPRKINISPKQSVDGPIPWSVKTDTFHVESSKELLESSGWLEKKNARNILSNFVSTQRSIKSDEKTREIPIQRLKSADKAKQEKTGLSSSNDTPSKRQTSFESKTTSVLKNNKESKRSIQKVQFGATSNAGGVKSSVLVSKQQKLSVEKASSVDSPKLSPINRKAAVSRKMSSERFERLKFDFERGVAPNAQERRGSESTDHLELKKKVNELAKEPREVKITKSDSFKRKEESIFASGLKVSDFVQQVNQLNPEPPKNAGRKWKNQQSKLKRSSVVIEDGVENEYLEVSDGDTSDTSFSEGIYELVPDMKPCEAEDFDNNTESALTISRRYGVYRKQKGVKKPSFKVRNKSESLSHSKRLSQRSLSTSDLQDNSENPSEGDEDWETDSNSTTYEPVDDENLYEEAGFSDEEKEKKKKKKKAKDGSSIGLKLSAQATSVLNRIGNRLVKIGKNKGDGGGSAGTDSDADTVDEAFVDDMDKPSSLSRSGSERSSGRRKQKDTSETTVPKTSGGETSTSPPSLPPPMPKTRTSKPVAPDQTPPLPPRSSVILQQPIVKSSPPLPPRNVSSSGLGLDTVVPVDPTTDAKRTSIMKKGSYLYGQEMKTDDSTDGAEEKEPYMDYDPASSGTISKKSSTTSSYIYPDAESWCSYPLAPSEDSGLYLELDDDQVYGQLGQNFTTTFESEPLYQFYTKDYIRTSRKLQMDKSIADESVVVKKGKASKSSKKGKQKKKDGGIYEDVEHVTKDLEPPQEDDVEVESKSSDDSSPTKHLTMMDMLGHGGSLHRALWCEMPEVKSAGTLDKIDDQERKIQEAMFEIITSEASYLKSLNILISVFLMAPEFSSDHSDRCVVTKRERQVLFSNIGTIRDASERFLYDLECRWQESCLMSNICDIVFKHSEENFEPYVRYTSNQVFQERMLEMLKKRTEYVEAVRRLEQNPQCQSLPMSSFLLLPMQRITRLPLLVDSVCHRLEPGTDRHTVSQKALQCLNRVVKRCNDGAKKMQQTEQMCLLVNHFDFKVKEIPLVSASRYLVKQGELTRIVSDTGSRIPFGKAFRGSTKHNIWLFLFNDILLIAKKKGTMFSVTDYCQRNSLHVEKIDSTEKCRHLPLGIPSGCKSLFLMVILENHEKKQVEMVLSCNSPSDRTRWIDAVNPVRSNDETERIYEDWDCPQGQCIRKYSAREPDELGLEESDIVNVYKKMSDGWYEGERIRDGERGWFPAYCIEEIVNSHVRARNLRMRYRLLMASQNLTEANRMSHA
ncbi:serine-rich adhesin for platelets-like isoform X2 [Gigantopelta aegis]|uniref:serine-rich adhesin for platelets-like isoform X2 n=1 Tax=Gigantopelta aegis TaxID=1735272 RepID=UPI001B88BE2D|nr:serine-rich adhesin for platelets-like isoform X2 [Gigantopelta aegis]